MLVYMCVFMCICTMSCMCVCVAVQVVTGQSLGEVSLKVISHVRFALLDPDKLSQVERDNHQKKFIPVSYITSSYNYMHPQLNQLYITEISALYVTNLLQCIV